MDSWQVPSPPRIPGDGSAPLVAHDSATGTKQPIGPESGTAKIYVCGITPYDATHIGHANTYLTFDLLNRVWLDRGLTVEYVQNVTDVDDPLLERAHRDGVDWRVLAREQIALFREDMTALNVLPPQQFIGATEAIDEVVHLIERLRELGTVYRVDDPEYPDYYFTTTDAPGYVGLSGLSREQALATFAERGGDPDRPGKRDPLDALLWRLARPGEPSWPSALGEGRPGWHIECAAIALENLGPAFDVQGGGSDLVFPHHEMSAAHAHTASGRPFAQHWLHSGMVGLDGEKMSKSKGNLVFVSRLRHEGVDPRAIRLALLAQHYRDDWMWTYPGLCEATDRLARWREAVHNDTGLNAAATIAEVRAALRDDLDAPRALAAIDAWAGGSLAIDSDDTEAPGEIIDAVDALLGVNLRG
ncbi:cysteine--1-D-myo-inosityl 2-amino-2-deoxy-alpha-D-glucopyranoside ligase [Enemella sp. A6]|uniref:cysteine--1-D-myo-inosityl 2-amino-2-deoxy-alpha-D-glucopyranoside ligase n=1 Tax=Enemella sp. A6 TaxID=3440152 RepID=UPI003EBC2E77